MVWLIFRVGWLFCLLGWFPGWHVSRSIFCMRLIVYGEVWILICCRIELWVGGSIVSLVSRSLVCLHLGWMRVTYFAQILYCAWMLAFFVRLLRVGWGCRSKCQISPSYIGCCSFCWLVVLVIGWMKGLACMGAVKQVDMISNFIFCTLVWFDCRQPEALS